MRRAPVIVFAALALVSLAGVAIAGVGAKRDLAFSLGVPPLRVAVVAPPNVPLCQTNIDVVRSFDAVQFIPRSVGRPGPPLSVAVRATATRAALAGAQVPSGSADNRPLRVRVGRVAASRGPIDVCITAQGPYGVGLAGGNLESMPSTRAYLGDRIVPKNSVALDFHTERSHTLLSQLPRVFHRASLFHPQWVGAWTFWLLAAMVAVAVPALLAWALAGVADIKDRD
jgi:hypothetical protein